MLNLDLQRLMDLREIQSPLKFLVKSGFTYQAARRLLNNELASFRHIEKLCIALNCTPDDLFNWVPDKGIRSPKQLALIKLTGRQHKGSLTSKIKGLPEEKLQEVHQFIDKLNAPE